MNQDFLDLENWIGMLVERSFSHEESVLALYLFSETIRKLFVKNPSREIYKTIAAASIVLSTKILGDGEYFTICEMGYICPPYPPFLVSDTIVKAEKFILETFDYNLVNVINDCFNIEHRLNMHKQILSRKELC